jgi:Replication-relaxation
MNASPGLPVQATEVVASVAQHRVLSTPQVQAIHFGAHSLRWAQDVLARLAAAGLLEFVPSQGAAGSPRRLWFATEHGARVAVEAGALEAMPKLTDAEAAAGPLQAHTLAVNEAGIAFVRVAREYGDECGPLGWRHEVPFWLGRPGRGRALVADAILTYLRLTKAEVIVEQRFLELDRATLSVDRLAAELARYGRFLRSEYRGRLVWESQFSSFPPILCVLSGGPRPVLERRRDAAVAVLRGDPEVSDEALSIRFCLAVDLAARGPFEPIFTDVHRPESPVSWLLPDDEEGGN